MATETVTTGAHGIAGPEMNSTVARLRPLLMQICDTKISRRVEAVRKNLLTCGTADAVRAVLAAMASGPAPARPKQIRDFVARLSMHFWRPDFHAAESKSLNDDFQRLLAGLTADDLAAAYDAVLLNPETRYFPTPGQVRGCIADRLAERTRVQTGAALALEILDATPESDEMIDPARARQIMVEFRKAAKL